MASPLSKGLIAGAIGESGGSIFPTLAPVPLAQAEKTGLEFAQKIGAPSLKDLRSMSTLELYQKSIGTSLGVFKTTIDGYFLTQTLPETFESKQQAMVPLLLGWNSEEMTYRALTAGKDITNEIYIQKVKELYGNKADEVLKLYPVGTPEVTEQSATDLTGDRFIAYSTWKWFDLHRKNSSQPVYRYLYSKLRPPLVDNSRSSALAGGTVKTDANAPKPRPAIGAPHACEIEYCMGNLHLIKEYAWTPEDYQVSKTMFSFFANFIKTGNPNGASLPTWPSAQAQEKNPAVMVIDVESKAVPAANDARYEFLDRFYKN